MRKFPSKTGGNIPESLKKEIQIFGGNMKKKFWEDYNARVRADGKNGEFDKAKEPKRQPNLFVDVDKSLCIGCLQL